MSLLRFVGGTPLTLNYNNQTETDIPPGDVVVFAGRPMIANAGVPAGAVNVGLHVAGGWYWAPFLEGNAAELTLGAALFWDAENQQLTNKEADGTVPFGFVAPDSPLVAASTKGTILAYHWPVPPQAAQIPDDEGTGGEGTGGEGTGGEGTGGEGTGGEGTGGEGTGNEGDDDEGDDDEGTGG